MKKTIMTIFSVLLWASNLLCNVLPIESREPTTFKAVCVNVVDGDTIDIILSLGFATYRKERIRLYGINAYESKHVKRQSIEETAKGKEATLFLRNLIEGKDILVETVFEGKGKFGRYLANIYINDRQTHINKLMVEKGFAVWKEY